MCNDKCKSITYSSQGPKGDTGATGATGPQGPAGTSGTIPPVINQTTATATLNGTTDSGSLILLNRGAGADIILPTTPANGTNYTLMVATAASTGSYTITTGAGNTFTGSVYANETASPPVLYTTTTATSINLNGTTSGGLVGTDITMTFYLDKWYVNGNTAASGILITPFA